MLRLLALVAGSLSSTFAVAVTTHIWPTDPDCAATLQTCIGTTAAAGDTVLIAANGPIDETINIGKPLTLGAASGYRPTFASGRQISGFYNPGAGVSWNMTITGLRLIDGDVGVRVFSGDATITLRDLVVATSGSTYLGCAVGVDNFGGGALSFDIGDNFITMTEHLGQKAIAVTAGTSTTLGSIAGDIHDNRIVVAAPGTSGGIQVYEGANGVSHARVYANQMSGTLGSGIELAAGTNFTGDAISNTIACTGGSGALGLWPFVLSSGAADFQLFNNTIAGCDTGVQISGQPGNLRLTNNLIAFNHTGVMFNSGVVLSNDHNLLFGNGSNAPTFVPGGGTVTQDPRLRDGAFNARLNAGSPAIDVGNTAALTSLLSSLALPAIDADGSRRIKGAGSSVDIGAFEFGDATFLHRDLSSGSVMTFVHDASVDAQPSRLPQLTSDWNPDGGSGIYNAHPLSLNYDTPNSAWYVYADDTAALPTGASFNIYAPALGNGNFRHSPDAGTIPGYPAGTMTQISVSGDGLDAHADRVVLVTRDSADPPGSGTLLEEHAPFGASYASGHWYIAHLDASTMFVGGSYHVYWQEPSLTAFRHVASGANIAGDYTLLDHPLLNAQLCARFHVAQSADGTLNPHQIGVYYNGTRQQWAIFNQDKTAMPAGAEFHVVIDAQQVFECSTDLIFANGFDG